MNLLSHLTEEQRQAVRTGSVSTEVSDAICGHGVTHDGETCRCNVCLMPVTLDAEGRWIYTVECSCGDSWSFEDREGTP